MISRLFSRQRGRAANPRKNRIGTVQSLESRQMMAGDVANPTIDQAIAGDSNLDGAFDSSDLVAVFTAAKFETGRSATWAEGDWNRDGFFNTSDLVTAFSQGCYGQPAPDSNVVSSQIVLSPRAVFDPTFGMTATTVLVPEGWVFNSGIQYGSIPSLALSGFVYAANPQGTLGFEGFQADPNLSWTIGPFGAPPIGQTDFRGLVFSPPVDGLTYFQQNLLPTLRQQHPDYEVVNIRREPGLIAAQSNAHAVTISILGSIGARIEFDAISVQARYQVNGEWVDESFIAQFSYTTSVVGQFTSTDWGLTSIERAFAPRGELNNALPLLRTIGRSAVVNPSWWIALNSHRAQLHGIVQNSQQEFNNYIESQNALASRRDAIYEEFVQYIRGTDVVRDPFSGQAREVSADGDVWFSSTGQVIVNADPTFNPNQEIGGTWRKPG